MKRLLRRVPYSIGPLLGNVESGVAGTLIGLRAAAASGGLLCVAAVVAAIFLLPAFWRYDSAQCAEAARGTA